ncbi:MAG: uncharacterized protein A8A55_0277 [Amphiamblys sp. WSBS2006]|nr:MAG: uncharacterized protein A8A55_0277 [Amphiamblys sp. WSBS2006]
METGTIQTLKHNEMFFVFTHQSIFLVPESEYNQIAKKEEGHVCLKRKYLSEVTDRDVERIICIVCHGEAAPEDPVSPLCRQMHFVLCRKCMEYLKERTDKREVVCPYCKEKKSDKAYQEEILAVVLSLMPHQTLHSLEIGPDMEVKTVETCARNQSCSLQHSCLWCSVLQHHVQDCCDNQRQDIYLWPRQLPWSVYRRAWLETKTPARCLLW